MHYSVEPIGIVHSCYKEKFAIPRQPGLAPAATAIIEILPDYAKSEAFSGLESSSHIWVEFIFHAGFKRQETDAGPGHWQTSVRPPRLGGNQRMGVFATRSPNRPNKMGLSAVKLEQIAFKDGGVQLHIAGHDLLDGTPVLDIKPYVPYADSLSDATNGFAAAPPVLLPVTFSRAVNEVLASLAVDESHHLSALIEQILQQDPRPSYQYLDEKRIYGVKLMDWQVRWRYRLQNNGEQEIVVEQLEPVS